MKIFKIARATAVTLMVLVMAGSVMALPNASENFPGLPSGLYQQQDKIYNNFTDVIGNFTGNTEIKYQTLAGYVDVHTVSFGGVFVRDEIGSDATPSIYDITYTIEVDPLISNLWINTVGLGIDQSFGSGTNGIAYFEKKVWAGTVGSDIKGASLLDVTISGNTGDYDVGMQKKLFIEDILYVNGAIVNSISNSFTQTARSVPEPGTLGLLGLGLAGLFTVARRRAWRA